MEKNVSLRSVVVLLAVWSLAACGSDGAARSTASSDESTVATTSAEVASTSAEAASTAPAVEGFTFTPPAGDYSIVFPDEPTANEQTAPLQDGTSLPVTFYLTESAGTAFGTAAIVYPPGSVVSLEGARDGAIANISGGTLTSSEPITLQGREGLQFSASLQDGQSTYLSRMYADDVSLYQVIAVVIGGEVAFEDPQVAGFFESFRFTTDL